MNIKKRNKFYLLRIPFMLLAVSLILVSCKTDKKNGTITFSEEALTLDLIETKEFNYELKDTTEEVTFTLSKEGVIDYEVDGTKIKVSAKTAGSVVLKGSITGSSAEITITVADSGIKPIITLDTKNQILFANYSIQIEAIVTYKGITVEEAEIIYSSSDETLATVDGKGVVTTKAYNKDKNKVTITVTANYQGLNSESKSFEIEIMEDITLIPSVTEINLYTSNLDNSAEYITEIDFSAIIFKDGEDLGIEGLSFEIENTEIAKYVDGKVHSVSNGKTKIIISYTSISGVEYFTDVTINVVKTEVVIEHKIQLDKNKGNQTFRLDGYIDADLNGATIKIDNTDVSSTITNKEITLETLEEVIWGSNLDIVIETEKVSYIFKADVVSIIKDVNDFMMIRTNYWKNRSQDNSNKYRDGWYVLGNNIDFTGELIYSVRGQKNNNEPIVSPDILGFNVTGSDDLVVLNMWHGVLDGAGYSLINLDVGMRGMFGVLAQESEFKNIGLIANRAEDNWWAAVALRSYGLIDNVFVLADNINNGNGNAVFVKELFPEGRITNSIATIKTPDTTQNLTNGVIAGHASKNNQGQVTNTFAIVPKETIVPAIGTNNPDLGTSVFGKFYKHSDLVSAVKNKEKDSFIGNVVPSFDSYNLDIWTISDNGITFNSLLNYFTSNVQSKAVMFEGVYNEGSLNSFVGEHDLYTYEVSGEGSQYVEMGINQFVIKGVPEDETFEVDITVVSIVNPTVKAVVTVTLSNIKQIFDFTDDFTLTINKSLDTVEIDLNEYINGELGDEVITINGIEINGELLNKVLILDELTAINWGEGLILNIENSNSIYRFNIDVISIISTFEEFELIRTNYWLNRSASNSSKYRDGWYKLANDIDFTKEVIYAVTGGTDNTPIISDSELGFNITASNDNNSLNMWHGVLDGNGFTLNNIKIHARGMLGVIAENSVVKNLRIIGTPSQNDWWGALAIRIFGLIDNCYILIDSLNNKTNGNAVVARDLGATGRIRNTIVEISTPDTVQNTYNALIVGNILAANKGEITNVFGIAPEGTVIPSISGNFKPDLSNSVFGKFITNSELVTAILNNSSTLFEGEVVASFDGFNSDYWTINEDSISWTNN